MDSAEVTPIGGPNAPETQMLGDSHHGSVHETETKGLILLVELQDAGITFLGKIRDEERTLDETLMEESLCAETQSLPQEVIDFGDYR